MMRHVLGHVSVTARLTRALFDIITAGFSIANWSRIDVNGRLVCGGKATVVCMYVCMYGPIRRIKVTWCRMWTRTRHDVARRHTTSLSQDCGHATLN